MKEVTGVVLVDAVEQTVAVSLNVPKGVEEEEYCERRKKGVRGDKES